MLFREPVDIEEVPDYLDLIKKPMDFSTMRAKVEDFKYETFGESFCLSSLSQLFYCLSSFIFKAIMMSEILFIVLANN